MTRCAQGNRVFFWEEPLFDVSEAFLEIREAIPNLKVVIPHLPSGLDEQETCRIQEWLLAEMISEYSLQDFIAWYYTPLALEFSRKTTPVAIVYDCMDELSGFRGASPALRTAEAELFRRADLVFTGGKSLYEGKRRQHPAVHCFPSSIDRQFFETARQIGTDIEEQASIPHPRLGFCGVIDERMDMDLLAAIADARPNWHFVMLGPVVKISDSELPKRPNIHYLGSKEYHSLPLYFAGWDVGVLPFARNEATRFISPTKTPEYLAAGLPAVSTPIMDVVEPYGRLGLVEIGETAEEWLESLQRAIASRYSRERLARVDKFLKDMSWDGTWQQMSHLLDEVIRRNRETEIGGQTAVSGTTAAD